MRKRGPKVRRAARQDRDLDHDPLESPKSLSGQDGAQQDDSSSARVEMRGRSSAEPEIPKCISKAVLRPIVRLYQQYSYSVWPVVDAEAVLRNLDDIEPETTGHDAENFACLVTALCAATMAQLHLAPVVDGSRTVDCATMAQTCLRIRGHCDSHHEHLDLSSILVSFFLHVYHAKVNRRTSAMMYIQEAISGARILRLDEGMSWTERGLNFGVDSHSVANKELIFPLLWVSERFVDECSDSCWTVA